MSFSVACELYAQSKFKEAFDLFLKCDLTDAVVQYNIGYMYLLGEGTEQSSDKAAEWLLKAANQGYSKAQWQLGYLYHISNYINDAFFWYSQAAEQGDSEGQLRLGALYEHGRGVSRSYEEAVSLYTKAAKQGNVTAQGYLGNMYRLGKGVKQDASIAAQWFQRAADGGDVFSLQHLGYMYKYGNGVEQDYDAAVKCFKLAANQGNASAQIGLGTMYQFGQGVHIDYNKAYQLYYQAASNGEPAGYNNLATLYLEGNGVEKNHKTAIDYLEKAAEEGYALAFVNLAIIYEKGYIEKKDLVKAKEYYKRASEDESSIGLFSLAMYYLLDGQEENQSLALQLLKKAADMDFGPAQSYLGELYSGSSFVKENRENAIYYWHRAARNVHGDKTAAYKLGYAYYDGYGVERDLKKAKEYFDKAIEQGYHCSYALNMVKHELGELDDGNKMREYAETLMQKNIRNDKIYQRISKDLQKDFGETWNISCRETKKFLETGLFTYFSLYSLGPHIYGNVDFSASITLMCKAFEKELGKYLYSGYIEFLKKQDVDPNTFPQKRSFLKRISANELAFKDSFDLKEFTLGNLHLTVGLERKPQFAENDAFKYMVDQTMLDYLNSIFKEDAFGEAKREREITDYIIYLTQEVISIADSLRNPAAHDQSMKIKKAEDCGNYIIKVKKLLFGFLSKLK